MHHHQRSGGAELDREVAVADGVQAVLADGFHAQRAGDAFAVQRVAGAGQRGSSERQAVDAAARIDEALDGRLGRGGGAATASETIRGRGLRGPLLPSASYCQALRRHQRADRRRQGQGPPSSSLATRDARSCGVGLARRSGAPRLQPPLASRLRPSNSATRSAGARARNPRDFSLFLCPPLCQSPFLSPPPSLSQSPSSSLSLSSALSFSVCLSVCLSLSWEALLQHRTNQAASDTCPPIG